MFGYFFRYFIARASYDAVRAGARRRSSKTSHALAQARFNQANARLAAIRAPTLDDNMLAAGKRHALLGTKLREVEACYGEGEELPASVKGVSLRAYRLNAFSVCVSFWKGRSFQETWAKTDLEKRTIESGELLALLENKTPGHFWSPLKSSSRRLWWWTSPLGLIGCYEIRDAGQSLLHVVDSSSGAPSSVASLPAAALPTASKPKKPRSRVLMVCGIMIGAFVIYYLVRVGNSLGESHAQIVPVQAFPAHPSPAPSADPPNAVKPTPSPSMKRRSSQHPR